MSADTEHHQMIQGLIEQEHVALKRIRVLLEEAIELARITGHNPYEFLVDWLWDIRPHTTREPIRESGSRRTLSVSKVLAVFANDSYACVRCESRDNLTIDHIIPVSGGGGDDRDNLQTLCRPCNLQKGAR